jgi:MFS family permease
VLFGSVWSFAANCFGPFYHVFMFEQLNFSAFDVGILSTLTALGGALALPAWGRLLDRFGNKPVMTFALIVWQLQNFLWCFITPENRSLLYGMWIFGGLTSACFILGQFTLLLRLLPVEAKNLDRFQSRRHLARRRDRAHRRRRGAAMGTPPLAKRPRRLPRLLFASAPALARRGRHLASRP